jgi:hypothetical protein
MARSSVDEPLAGADQQAILLFMTTEHFTLQSARAAANAEISSRLQLYMTTLSSTIIALALAAQLSGLGPAFRVFALVLLPVVYFLGVVTLGRLRQVASEWRSYGQAMSRIRHYYLELAPQMGRYLLLPASDDPWTNLTSIGIRSRSWAQSLVTAPAMLVVVNSVVAGVVGALVGSAAWPSSPAPLAACAAAGFVLSLVILGMSEERAFRRNLAAVPVAFPDPPSSR